MPCTTIHMLTAGRVLDRWRARPRHAPFSVDSVGLRTAFLLGAMGPDMGFVPGVERFVSELSHYVSTADLSRALLERARTPLQQAYAWGWGTHHVTDVEIHPLVGRACGERLHGDRDRRLNSSADLPTHVGMEVGLDIVFLETDPGIPRPPGRPLLDRGEIRFLVGALEEVYGLPWGQGTIDDGFRTSVRRTARWPGVLGLLRGIRGLENGDRRRSALRRLAGRVLDAAGGVVGEESAVAGFLRPLRPPQWMLARVREVADTFPERFQSLVEDRLAGLENRNLETGLAEDADVEHPDSERTLRRLRALREGRAVGAPR